MLNLLMECKKEIGNKNYLELLEVITEQERVIVKQGEMIVRLINETAEKENMINELTKDIVL